MRRNPLLMTVIGNPGRRYQENPFILVDSGTLKIIRSWKGSMTDRKPWLWAQEAARRLDRDVFVVAHPYVPHGFKAGVEVSKMFFAGGPWQVVSPDGGSRQGDWGDLSPRRNPTFGASVVGSLTGGLIANALSNPAISSTWDRMKLRPRYAVLEFAGVPAEQAARLAHRPWGTLPPSIQEMVGMGWQENGRARRAPDDPIDQAISAAWPKLCHGVQVPIMDIPRIFRDVKLEMAGGLDLETAIRNVAGRYRVNRNPGRGLRPKRVGVYCRMCGEWDPRKGPYRTPKVGPKKGSVICDLCYRGWRSGRRAGEPWARNRVTRKNPGNSMPTKKVTMSIEKFAKLIRARNDPKLWNDFVSKVKGYHKWSHGTWPKRVTVEVIRKPGVSGIWMTYDMGKEPEKTYIMPKGSKRKGAWKHPWERMPSLKGDPEAGIMITKMTKGNRLTDFLHG